jgi:DNA-binding MarR family transcriptional regulator
LSIPPLPDGLQNNRRNRVANSLHSIAIHLLRRARAVDRETGLSPQRLSLLSVLAYAGPKTVSQLADAEQVSRPAISVLLTALEKKGLARRERSQSDARRVLVHATPKGKHLMERGRRRRVERIACELATLSPSQLALLDRAARVLGEV